MSDSYQSANTPSHYVHLLHSSWSRLRGTGPWREGFHHWSWRAPRTLPQKAPSAGIPAGPLVLQPEPTWRTHRRRSDSNPGRLYSQWRQPGRYIYHNYFLNIHHIHHVLDVKITDSVFYRIQSIWQPTDCHFSPIAWWSGNFWLTIQLVINWLSSSCLAEKG